MFRSADCRCTPSRSSCLLLGAMLLCALAAGCREANHAEADVGQVTLRTPAALPSGFSQYYQPIESGVTPETPSYDLPLDLDRVSNRQLAEQLSEAQVALLRENGFVVAEGSFGDDVRSAYRELRESNRPVWITSDAVLHVYHLQFDATLREIEEQKLYPDLVRLSQALLQEALARYNGGEGELKEAAGRNAAYFGVAVGELTGTLPTLPKNLADVAQQERQLIEAHAGFSRSPLFHYQEDYSQYLPRGHYTQSETLKKYFKAMMWYGRLAFLLKGQDLDPRALVSAEDARIQTLGAALIATHLYSTDLADLWGRIYAVSAFFAGFADDLTPTQYAQEIAQVAGTAFAWSKLAEPATLEALRERLAALPKPRIYSGTGAGQIQAQPPFTREQLSEALGLTQGLRLMGQRLTPDGFMMQRLILPAVGAFTGQGKPFTMEQTQAGPARCFSRGLDVMAALGSARALEILEQEGDTAYEQYDGNLAELQSEFGGLPAEQWSKNLYWGWFHALRSLLEPLPAGYPTFMRTQAWGDRQLHVALASWAQLRHDTILYAKQPYAMPTMAAPPGVEPEPPEPDSRGFVEPLPEFYARLLALTRCMQAGLQALDMLPEEAGVRLQNAEAMFEQLLEISRAEVSGQRLSEEQYKYVREFDSALGGVTVGLERDQRRTTIIADVLTDANTLQVLEEGTGNLRLLVGAFSDDQGRLQLGQGVTLSYYEFKHPMADRLTDEKWRERLGEEPPPPPQWIRGFVAP